MEIEAPGILFSIAAFLLGFSLLVFIHEWGHFIVARMFGVKVDTFSIGMGKEIYGRTDKNGMRWKIGAFPIGGYVKFFGDASAASNPGDVPDGLSPEERDVCFHFKPLWQKSLIVFAGPAINLLAAAMVFSGFVYTYGIQVAEPVIAGFSETSGARSAGLLVGDKIISINGESVERFNDIGPIVRLRPSYEVPIQIERDGRLMNFQATLGVAYFEDRFDNKYPYGVLGVTSLPGTRLNLGPVDSFGEGVRQTASMTKTMFTTLGQIVIGLRSVTELGGPPRIASMVGEAANRSIQDFIWILALLSLNLGIVNLLPIPVLDGGHLLFFGLEAVKGSPLRKKAQEASFIAGMAFLLIFMVFVTLNDLQSMAL